MSHRQLTASQRYQISALLGLDFSHQKMADIIGVSRSTISRELLRNHLSRRYNPDLAQGATDDRRMFSRKARVITLEIENLIIFFLKFGYSPVMICHILRHSHNIDIAFQTIYNHIETDRIHGGELYKLLPFKGRARRSEYHYRPWNTVLLQGNISTNAPYLPTVVAGLGP
ncbi:MAG: IS30 family transposase [Ketobacter sp.]|nr:MAG: IS30 family transposase [Ketobacter sp.]